MVLEKAVTKTSAESKHRSIIVFFILEVNNHSLTIKTGLSMDT